MSACPYWPDKRVEDTHILVLIPQTVNKTALTLNSLEVMLKKPMAGGAATKYKYFGNDVKKELGDQGIPNSYWALMTKEVLPCSQGKTFKDQLALIEEPYSVPEVLELVTGILMHYVKSGQRLFPYIPNTYSRCLERVGINQENVLVGSFSSSGLSVYGCYGAGNYERCSGLCVVRKL